MLYNMFVTVQVHVAQISASQQKEGTALQCFPIRLQANLDFGSRQFDSTDEAVNKIT